MTPAHPDDFPFLARSLKRRRPWARAVVLGLVALIGLAAAVDQHSPVAPLEPLNIIVPPGFASAEARARAKICLAKAIYFEARSEPVEGQMAVGQVILNRRASSRYPATICEVVFQGEERRNRCQFSFACDGKSDVPGNPVRWRVAQDVAAALLSGPQQDLTEGALYYHADYVSPSWAKRFRQTRIIGRHIFYQGAG